MKWPDWVEGSISPRRESFYVLPAILDEKMTSRRMLVPQSQYTSE